MKVKITIELDIETYMNEHGFTIPAVEKRIKRLIFKDMEGEFGEPDSISAEVDKGWFYCNNCDSYQEGQCICYAR